MPRNSSLKNSHASPAQHLGEIAQLFSLAAADKSIHGILERVAARTTQALKNGGRLFLCGNGGSAAEATHFAGELVGPFYNRKRAPFSAIPLGFDPSSLSAVANDFGYDQIFSRQLQGLGRRGDVLWALTTSGRSPNVLAALKQARKQGIWSVVFTNHHGGLARHLADACLQTPEAPTPRVQEFHLAYGHWLCQTIEQRLAQKSRRST